MDNYFDKALEFDNLLLALKQCSSGVRWKDSVAGYEANGIRNTLKLKADVLSGKYKIDKYQQFIIHEPKERVIMATRIKDRQLQRALCNAGLYQDIVESFILDNVACQVGKGTDFMIKRMKIHMRRYYRKYGANGWVLKCDVKHFFPSINHDIAKQVMAKRVGDERAREIVFKIIDSFEGDTGIGLGSQISQLIALAMLDDLDHIIKEKLHVEFYMRYMDDFILVFPDRQHLEYCLDVITEYLHGKKLELNRKTCLYPLRQGIRFCQWKYSYTPTGGVRMRLSRQRMRHERQKLRKLIYKEQRGEVAKGTSFNSFRSWYGNADRGNTYADKVSMLNYYNNKINESRGTCRCLNGLDLS